ncbi:MAG: hypothetical protein IPJ65_03165 [Archangiaceae bacterium]|nr:hypothetical protein [Archangiaceae bacterium]
MSDAWQHSQAAERLKAAASVEVGEPPPLSAVRRVVAKRARRNAQLLAFALALPLGAAAAVGGYAMKTSPTLPLPPGGEGRGEGVARHAQQAKPTKATLPPAPDEAEVEVEAAPAPARAVAPARVKPEVVATPLPVTPTQASEATPEIPAIAGYAPPPPPSRTALADEASTVTEALTALRVKRDPAHALELLQKYRARYPAGTLRREAALATFEAHRALGHSAEALAALEELPRRPELEVLRAELNAELGHCDVARSILRGITVPASLDERAGFTDASCALTLGARDEAIATLQHLDSPRAQALLKKLLP